MALAEERSLILTPTRRPSLCWWSIVGAVLPFLLIYLAHFCNTAGSPTGFIQTDMPYYNANGREIFERGNGVSYPNPYDPAPHPPVIYFHWLIWVFGFGITQLRLDPGLQFLSIGLASALCMSILTWKLVAESLPKREHQRSLFFLSMWGGGVLVLWKLITNIFTGESWNQNLLAFDPEQGLWFLSWGRNVLFPTEATYHLLVAACWLSMLKGRYWWGVLFAGLLASTHPWSGLEILGTLSAYWGLRFLFDSRKQALPFCLLLLSMVVVFLGYNLKYLDSFPEHSNLRQKWNIDWSLTLPTILLAWGPIGLVALYRLGKQKYKRGWNEAFLLLAFGVAFALSMHDRFMKPTQPLHFTRGYVWMPLFLLALPVLQDGATRLLQQRRFAVLLTVCCLACIDNMTFISTQIAQQSQVEAKYFLSKDQLAVIDWLNSNKQTGVVVCEDSDFSYLLATYTSARPYVGHHYNTPDKELREEHILKFLERRRADNIDWMEPVDLFVLTTSTTNEINGKHYEKVFIHEDETGEGLAIIRFNHISQSP